MDDLELKKALVGRRAGAVETMAFSMAQNTINQVVMKLDLARHRMTLKWGVDRLYDLASPELKVKWDSHMEQLNSAMIAENVPLVEELVDGGCRGWAALERGAVAGGHVPFEPRVWEVEVGGTVYRVVRTHEDASAVASWGAAGKIGAGEVGARPVVTLEELVRVFHLRHQETFGLRQAEAFKQGEYVASGRPMNEDIGF